MLQVLHPTRIDIPDNVRAAMIDLLNARLADAVRVRADDLAERIATLGGTAHGTAEVGDADTDDLFVGVSRDIDRNLRLVEAHARAAG